MSARTIRLPPALLAEADAFAASLGISFNALAAVALRDYLDGRSLPKATSAPAAPSQAVEARAAAQPPRTAQAAAKPVQAPPSAPRHAPPARAGAGGVKVGRNDPCPCGSGQKFKRCCAANGGPGA